MNQKTAYEIIIAEKLGQLHVPDLRKAIWSRIEDQLDMDMPDNDALNDPPSSPKGSNWISITKRFGTFAAIVAIATIFFINQKQSSPANKQHNIPASVQNIIPENEQTESPPGTCENVYTAKPNSIINEPSPINMSDSLVIIPLVIDPVTKDTTALKNLPPPVTKSDDPVKQDTIPKKKSKGFKGITDDDYKISLKKDSVP